VGKLSSSGQINRAGDTTHGHTSVAGNRRW
jgi:hypothetical protein